MSGKSLLEWVGASCEIRYFSTYAILIVCIAYHWHRRNVWPTNWVTNKSYFSTISTTIVKLPWNQKQSWKVIGHIKFPSCARCVSVRSRRSDCLVIWFCYHLIAKLANKTAAPPWPDPFENSVCKRAILCRTYLFSLWPNDAISGRKSGSTLAEVVVCCLQAPSHYLNQCWFVIIMVQ